jgi:hypothetical protein
VTCSRCEKRREAIKTAWRRLRGEHAPMQNDLKALLVRKPKQARRLIWHSMGIPPSGNKTRSW